jgi:hypothetical protein
MGLFDFLLGGNKTETTTTPSPLDQSKSDLIQQIAPYLMRYMEQGFSGIPSSAQMGSANTTLGEMKRTAGKAGIPAGDPRMFDQVRMMRENLTKPNQDVYSMAAGLFGTPVNMPGDSKTTTQPGIGELAQTAALMYMAFCWVAEELYGKDDMRTLLVRKWVKTHDNWFTRLYGKHGKRWAEILHKYTFIKPIVKPIWDIMWREQFKLELCLVV